MDIMGKNLNEYISVSKLPVVIYVVWTIFSALISIAMPLLGLLLALPGLVIGLGLPVYVGWSATKNKAFELTQAAVAGAVYGLIAAIAGGIVGIIMSLVGAGTTAAISGDTTSAMIGGGIGFVAAIIGMIIAMIVFPILGAILAAIGAFVAQSMSGSKK